MSTLLLVPAAVAGPLLNELLADPGTAAGDSNCDGVIQTTEDEFVEILNPGPADVDLSNATISDLVGVRHVFPADFVLEAGQTVVVWGGGTPTFDVAGANPWCVALPPEVLLLTASTGTLALNNTGDTITLADAVGTILDQRTYGSEADSDESIVVYPEGVATNPHVQHTTLGGRTWSPGVQSDGQTPWLPYPLEISGPFDGLTNQANTWEVVHGLPGDGVTIYVGTLLVNAPVAGCPGLYRQASGGLVKAPRLFDTDGAASATKFVGSSFSGTTVRAQAVSVVTCEVSNLAEYTFP